MLNVLKGQKCQNICIGAVWICVVSEILMNKSKVFFECSCWNAKKKNQNWWNFNGANLKRNIFSFHSFKHVIDFVVALLFPDIFDFKQITETENDIIR